MYQNLQYGDPARGLRLSVILSALIELTRVKKVRAKRLETKPELESRQGALFAYGRMLLENNSSMMFATVNQQAAFAYIDVIPPRAGTGGFSPDTVSQRSADKIPKSRGHSVDPSIGCDIPEFYRIFGKMCPL
jgi:hypothetical protein